MARVDKIIINFPTNIGDTIVALPALDRIKTNFPKGKITAIVSPKTEDFISKNTFINQIVLFDKNWPIFKKFKFCIKLRKRFDLIIDFKNSMLPILLGIKKHTSFFRGFFKNLHIKIKYLKLIEDIAPQTADRKSRFLVREEKQKKWNFKKEKPFIFFGCFSRSHRKEYNRDALKKLLAILGNDYNCVLLGLKEDQKKINQLILPENIINLIGKTDMTDIYYLLSNYAAAVIAVDSSIMHLASYLNIPVIGLFGPTAVERFYPYSEQSVVLKREDLDCIPCEGKKDCSDINCMDINPNLIIKEIEKILKNEKIQ